MTPMATSGTPAPLPAPPSGRRLAPLPRRVLAALVDVGLVTVVAMTVALLRVDLALGGSLADIMTTSLELAATASVVAVVVGLAHELLGVAVWGRTIGKRVLGLVVSRSDGHGRVGWYRAAVRAGVPFASGLAPMVGQVAPALVYGWLLRDEDRQGLHDKAARTVVVCAA